MNAVDEIQAAIGVLERIKAAPKPPYFSRWNDDDFSDGNYDDIVEEAFDYGTTYGKRAAWDRTIDAQLALLEAAIFNLGADRLAYTHATVAAAIRLARAINGTST